MGIVYRYTAQGEGIFSIGKRLLPDALVEEAWEARKWLPKPALPKGNYRFYLTEKGRAKYEATLLQVHKEYLSDIKCEEICRSALEGVVYQDTWQVAVRAL